MAQSLCPGTKGCLGSRYKYGWIVGAAVVGIFRCDRRLYCCHGTISDCNGSNGRHLDQYSHELQSHRPVFGNDFMARLCVPSQYIALLEPMRFSFTIFTNTTTIEYSINLFSLCRPKVLEMWWHFVSTSTVYCETLPLH